MPSAFDFELPELFIELPELLLEGIVELDEDEEGIVLEDDDGVVDEDDEGIVLDDDGGVVDEDGIVLEDDGVVVDVEDEGVVVSVVVVVVVADPGAVVVLVLDGEVVDGVDGDGEVGVDWATATPPIIRQAAAIAVVDLRNWLMSHSWLRLTNARLGVPLSTERATERRSATRQGLCPWAFRCSGFGHELFARVAEHNAMRRTGMSIATNAYLQHAREETSMATSSTSYPSSPSSSDDSLSPMSGATSMSSSPSSSGVTSARPELMERVVQGAHDTVDKLADKARPQVQRLQETASSASDSLHARADQARELGDEWAESLRATVREHPLAALGTALAIGIVVARLSR